MRMTQSTAGNQTKRPTGRWPLCAAMLAMALLTGCATGRAVRSADSAAKAGDWDTAVTFYREALGQARDRSDLRIKLERSTRMASAEHMTRARQLAYQQQLGGAVAEYRLSAELYPTDMLASQKAGERDRTLRGQLEAPRPRDPA